MLTLDKIYQAAHVLKKVANQTEVIAAPKINTKAQVYLKTENLQVTGSFKLRGAYYKISTLSEEEKQILIQTKTVWGCDRCQECCPYNQRAKKNGTIYSPIPFFNAVTLPSPSVEKIENMSDAEFASRAYSWRGRETILRNLHIKQKGDTPC